MPQFPHLLNGSLCLWGCWVIYLDSALDPSAVHPTGHIDCVSPDVVLGPASADHSRHHRANVDTWKTVTEWPVGSWKSVTGQPVC